MRPVWHIISSAILGIVIYFFTGSIIAGIIALLTGVFIDLDHLIDFWISAPKNPFSVKEFYHMDKYLKSKGDYYTIIFLHAFEWLIILAVLVVIYQNIYLVAIVLSILLHLTLDNFNLKKQDHPLSYSIIFRVLKKFKLA